jgi:hypothetical protein
MTPLDAQRAAKHAFMLANALKESNYSEDVEFFAALELSSRTLAQVGHENIDAEIGRDPRRLDDYGNSRWRLGSVRLDRCTVWQGMGQRPWAQGIVSAVAAEFRRRNDRTDRVWRMTKFAHLYREHLPIVIIERPGRFHIDDGSHRAVAMALAGVAETVAWIGYLDSPSRAFG